MTLDGDDDDDDDDDDWCFTATFAHRTKILNRPVNGPKHRFCNVTLCFIFILFSTWKVYPPDSSNNKRDYRCNKLNM